MIEPRMQPGGEWPLTEADYEKIDPGVRRLVRFLVGWRFHTTDSGDGKTKLETFGGDLDGEILDVPHVFMSVRPIPSALAEADRLMAKLGAVGVKASPGMIQLSYDPADESCVLMLTGVDDAMLSGLSTEPNDTKEGT